MGLPKQAAAAPIVLHSIANMLIEELEGTAAAPEVSEATIERVTDALYGYAKRGVSLGEPIAALLSIAKGAEANGHELLQAAIACILNDLGSRLRGLATEQARERNRAKATLGLTQSVRNVAAATGDKDIVTMKPWAVR